MKPMTLKVVDFPFELSQEAKADARRRGVTLREWVMEAMKEKLGKLKKGRKNG